MRRFDLMFIRFGVAIAIAVCCLSACQVHTVEHLGSDSNIGSVSVRPLQHSDRTAVETLCRREREYNAFLLARLDKLSVDQDLVEYWGQFDNAGRLVGVLRRYHVLWDVFDTPGTDLNAFARVIESKRQPSIVINDNVRTGTSLVPLLTQYRVELDLPARLRCVNRQRFTPPAVAHPTRRASLQDIERLAQFYARSPADVRRGRDSVRRSLGGGRRTFVAEVEDEVVAAGLTTAELPSLAMIGGLHTPLGSRGREHLLGVMAALVQSLLADGKQVCAVIRHPSIMTLCDSLGFVDIGSWRIVHMRSIKG